MSHRGLSEPGSLRVNHYKLLMILPFHVQLSTSCRHDGKGTFYNIFRLNACKKNNRGVVAEWVRASTDDRKLMVRLPLRATLRFGTLAIPLTLLCQCLSDETLKAVGPFYLVSMPGEVNDPTSPHWNV